ncbi:MAG: glucosidase [Rhodospirillales bacterium]|nr:glucosidase [Rhodospirillales bacterium]
MTPEHQRLAEAERDGGPEWRKWGPYVSERQWGTVREDLSETGDAWNDCPHDHARSRAFRWGEDGLAGFSDDRQILCFALALWNGADPILKERLFGLTNGEGNHGEDVKEYYYYLDATPTHSYMRCLYKYPHASYPYDQILSANRQRSRHEPEYELIDTGVFSAGRYFDVEIEYAKAAPEDILIVINAANRGDVAAELHLLPTLWFRNTWSWAAGSPQPNLSRALGPGSVSVVTAIHHELGDYYLYCDRTVPMLFTANETNRWRLYGRPNRTPYVKDGINDAIVNGRNDTINPAMSGTKAAAHYRLTLLPGASETVRLRLTNLSPSALRSSAGRGGLKPFAVTFEQTLAARREEADAFYATVIPAHLSSEQQQVMRQALAGTLWTKQVYTFDVETSLAEHGIDATGRNAGSRVRNRDWQTFNAHDVLSVPDKWEYPWFAAWDLAFQTVPLAMVDPAFAKQQLSLIIGDRYLHPTGQIPAYEWNFSNVMPPMHAWATRFVYHADRQINYGVGDLEFYKRSFTTLIANFTWWLNRRDMDGNTILAGGRLGLDTMGVFDRAAQLPAGSSLGQLDGTAWTAFYTASMLDMAADLADAEPLYAGWACRFLDIFLRIATSMSRLGTRDDELWDEADGFYYDVLRFSNGDGIRLKARSAAGLLPLCAVVVYAPPADGSPLQALAERAQAYFERYPGLAATIVSPCATGPAGRVMLAAVNEHQLRRILTRLLDPNEFLSDFGIRSLSRQHRDAPVTFSVDRDVYRLEYEPGETLSATYGGNTNWRGPIWMPFNLMIVEALLRYFSYYGEEFTVECPTGSGKTMTLFAVAAEIVRRLQSLFLIDTGSGRRPVSGGYEIFELDPHWRGCIPFHEYFHGDTGAGLGASHHTGWTGAIAKLMQVFATTTAADALRSGLQLSAVPAMAPPPSATTTPT